MRQVARGGSALDPEVVAHMLERGEGGPVDRLSAREREVLAEMAQGKSNAAIAVEIGIGEHTLQRHIGSVFAKLELPATGEEHRRVLAVLSYLHAQEA